MDKNEIKKQVTINLEEDTWAAIERIRATEVKGIYLSRNQAVNKLLSEALLARN